MTDPPGDGRAAQVLQQQEAVLGLQELCRGHVSQRNTPRRRVEDSMRRFLTSCGSRACLSLDEGSLGQSAALLVVDGLSLKGSGQKLPWMLGRCPEVLIAVVLPASAGGLR